MDSPPSAMAWLFSRFSMPGAGRKIPLRKGAAQLEYFSSQDVLNTELSAAAGTTDLAQRHEPLDYRPARRRPKAATNQPMIPAREPMRPGSGTNAPPSEAWNLLEFQIPKSEPSIPESALKLPRQ